MCTGAAAFSVALCAQCGGNHEVPGDTLGEQLNEHVEQAVPELDPSEYYLMYTNKQSIPSDG